MVVMVVLGAAAALEALCKLRVRLLRTADVAALQVLAQGLEVGLKLRFAGRGAGCTGRRGTGRRRAGRRGRTAKILRVSRECDEILLSRRDVATLQVLAKLLKIGDELLYARVPRSELRKAT